MKYWILYASRYGSSADVAQRVAEALGCQALDVTSREARIPPETDALALGGPIYGGLLYRPIREFIERHQKEILAVPRVVVFILGLQNGMAAERQLADAVPSWLSVHAAAVVGCGGRSDPARMKATDRLLLRVAGGLNKAVDRIDVAAIDRVVSALRA